VNGDSGEPSKKVLVVDDEQAIVTYLTAVLDDHGFETCQALDAETALAAAVEHRPDLICLDIMMPKQSGISLYQHFKLAPETRKTPIIFVSAFSQLHDLREPALFRKLVPDPEIPEPEACIEKPIDVDEFIRIVESLVGSSRAPTAGDGGTTP
jgi:CheY-like chemotaxis protein